MKIYFRILILVAVMCAAACLFTRSRLHTLRSEHHRLSAEVARREVLPKDRSMAGQRSARTRPGGRERAAKADGENAGKDPANAFALLAGMNSENRVAVIGAIISSARNNPERRTALLATLRDYLPTLRDPSLADEIRSEVFEAFARAVDPDSTDSAMQWISSETTAGERRAFAAGLAYPSTREASGRWIEWMSLNLTPEQLAQPVADLVEDWTREDYQSAGKWLAAAAESPARQVAVQAYVEAVASHEPHVAIQWAMTLPEGAKRDASLSAVHANWPLDDPEGKTAFQREHNME